MESELLGVVRTWLAEDPDPETRATTEAMIAAEDEPGLRDCFLGHLEFGTAGLRGALGPGPNRMNRALVRRVTAALPSWLQPGPVVIGFDARRGSRAFAEDAARVLTERGIVVYAFAEVVPTPELAHAVRYLGCAAGIMITASHNPPGDNGYKLYAANGAQIVPPADRILRDAIASITTTPDAKGPPPHPVPPSARAAYVDALLGLRVHPVVGARIVYTAMHGVGTERVLEVLGRAGHTDVHLVEAQCTPDGAFPTVRFPNPEEPGALDLALQRARDVGADIILANDPDADRLAVAIPDGEGGWRQLTGNQVGCLLAEDLLTHSDAPAPRMVATSLVSSAMLAHIARAHDARYAETLTGFKWIANAAIVPHLASGGSFVLGFEEALGYCVGSVVRDKDGISALLMVADLASWARARGGTLLRQLEALYRRYGVYASSQVSMQLPPGAEGVLRRSEIMGHLRQQPPNHLADAAVLAIRDVLRGEVRDLRTGETRPLDLPRSDVLAFDLADGSRVLCRPSGTEPKVKLYFEVCEPMKAEEPLAQAEARAADRLATLRDAVTARFEGRAQGS